MNVKLCKCGCETVVTNDSRGRPRMFVNGHQMRGRRPPDTCMAASIAARKGKPHSKSARDKISASKKGAPHHPNTLAATKGKHGFGRAARDNPNHHCALHWIIRDNRGVIHECDNLRAWCRSNEWRFLPDMRPWSKMPLHARASHGVSRLGQANGKVCSWHGWTLVSVVERQEQGAPDLMDREVKDPAVA
jgi:hypothetical protein